MGEVEGDAVSGPTWEVRVGDVLDELRKMPDESIQCVMTSPPYWGLRDYGVEGMIGLEPTLEGHLAKIVEVFGEVRRVLRDDGTLWMNYGDAYSSGPSSKASTKQEAEDARVRAKTKGYNVGGWGASDGASSGIDRCSVDTGLAAKQRLLMPARVALALQADGWWIRSEIVWAKGVSFCPTYSGSCMPSSVRDRPTDSHEMIYLLSKAPRYFYDADAVREKAKYGRREWSGGASEVMATVGSGDGSSRVGNATVKGGDPSTGRNIRTVWTIPEGEREEYKQFLEWKAARQGELTSTWVINPKGYKEAHFATFPDKLVEPCVKAGTSERGACSECGAPWVRVVDQQENVHPGSSHDHKTDLVGHGAHRRGDGKPAGTVMAERWKAGRARTTTGWEPTCEHADPYTGSVPTVPCVVLDPFSGSGTTGAVAVRLGRSYIGIELNPEYAALSRKRIGRAAAESGTGGTVTAEEDAQASQFGLFG